VFECCLSALTEDHDHFVTHLFNRKLSHGVDAAAEAEVFRQSLLLQVKGLTKISKIFTLSAPFDKFPQFCAGPQIVRRVADSVQNSVCAES